MHGVTFKEHLDNVVRRREPFHKCRHRGSNSGPSVYKTDALPLSYTGLRYTSFCNSNPFLSQPSMASLSASAGLSPSTRNIVSTGRDKKASVCRARTSRTEGKDFGFRIVSAFCSFSNNNVSLSFQQAP